VLIASDAVFEEIPEGPGALESLESAGFAWFRVTGTIVKMGIGLFRRFQPFGLFLVRSSRWGSNQTPVFWSWLCSCFCSGSCS